MASAATSCSPAMSEVSVSGFGFGVEDLGFTL